MRSAGQIVFLSGWMLLAGCAASDIPAGDETTTNPPSFSIVASPPSLSNSSTALFVFQAERAGSFECALDGAPFRRCGPEYQVDDLAEGEHTLLVRSVSGSGRAGKPKAFTWEIDLTRPDIAFTGTLPPSKYNQDSWSFAFTSTDLTATFECSLNGSTYTSCTSPRDVSGLLQGDQTFRVRAVDPAGNRSLNAASAAWTLDLPPETLLSSWPPASTCNPSATFTFTTTIPSEPVTFECRIDSGSFVPCTSPATYGGLASGSHTFSTRARDSGANTDPTPATYSWSVANDLSKPSAPATLTLIQNSPSRISFLWNPAVDNECAIGSYRIYRMDEGGGSFGQIATLTGSPPSTSYTNSSLLPALTYRYKVSGVNLSGTESDLSAELSATTITNLHNPSPAGFLPSGTTDAALSVVTDADSECRFSTARHVAFAAMTLFTSTGATSHVHPLSGLTDGGRYNYYVRCRESVSGLTNTRDFPVSFGVSSGLLRLRLDFDHLSSGSTRSGLLSFPLFGSMYSAARGYGYDVSPSGTAPDFPDRISSTDRSGSVSGAADELDFHSRSLTSRYSAPFRVDATAGSRYRIGVVRGDPLVGSTFSYPMQLRVDGQQLGSVGSTGNSTNIYRREYLADSVGSSLDLEFLMTACTPSGASDPLCNWGVNRLDIFEVPPFPTFYPKVDVSVGDGPSDIASGDFNQDGIPDLLVAYDNGNALGIFHGVGNGTFQLVRNEATGVTTRPSVLTLGDVDGDGHTDAFVGFVGSFPPRVYWGGAASDFTTFTEKDMFATGSESAHDVELADLNGDGRLDLLVANWQYVAGSDVVSYALNQGGRTFGTPATITVGDSPYSIAVGDYDNNGLLDLVVANYQSSTLTRYRQSVPGTFSAGGSNFFSNSPTAVALADLDNDGNLDIATARLTSRVAILWGDGAGGFSVPADVISNPLGNIRNIHAVDMNGDDCLDLVLSDVQSTGGNSIFMNNCARGFTPTAVNVDGPAFDGVAADFNLDGVIDWVTTIFSLDEFSILKVR